MSDTGLTHPDCFTGKKYALLIGIDHYPTTQDTYKDLAFPAAHAKELGAVLAEKYGFEEENVIVLEKDGEKDAKGIKKSILDLKKKLRPDDHLLVFFAGHGAIEGTSGYWVAYDAEQEAALNLPVSTVLDLLMGCCAQVLLLVDTCFSGQVTDRAVREGIFAAVKGALTEFMVLTSSTAYKETRDDSPFFRRLMHILRHEEVVHFQELVSMMSFELGDAVTFSTSATQTNAQFMLKQEDRLTPLLKEACFDLNFHSQKRELGEELLLQRFNLLYLHGTDICGHNIFVRHFFKKLQEDSQILDLIPQIRTLSPGEAIDAQAIWSYFTGGKLDGARFQNSISSTVSGALMANNRVFFIKIPPSFRPELSKELHRSIVAFWEQLVQLAGSDQPNTPNAARFYFFILDERGANGILASDELAHIPVMANTSRYWFSSITPMTPQKLAVWKQQRLPLTPFMAFQQINFTQFIPQELFVAGAIMKVCDLCERPNAAFDILFRKK